MANSAARTVRTKNRQNDIRSLKAVYGNHTLLFNSAARPIRMKNRQNDIRSLKAVYGNYTLLFNSAVRTVRTKNRQNDIRSLKAVYGNYTLLLMYLVASTFTANIYCGNITQRHTHNDIYVVYAQPDSCTIVHCTHTRLYKLYIRYI